LKEDDPKDHDDDDSLIEFEANGVKARFVGRDALIVAVMAAIAFFYENL